MSAEGFCICYVCGREVLLTCVFKHGTSLICEQCEDKAISDADMTSPEEE